MSVVTQRSGGGGGGYVERAPGGGSSSLADVVELILDKGLVIDVFVRVSLVGIEILTIDARVVVASVDTYLRFAEATNRLDLYEKGGKDLPGLVQGITEGGAKGKTSGVLEAAAEKVNDMLAEQPRAARGEEVRRRPVRQRATGERGVNPVEAEKPDLRLRPGQGRHRGPGRPDRARAVGTGVDDRARTRRGDRQ